VSARVLKVLDECSAFYEEEFLKGKVEVVD
jgi:hypothetical protein